jgi:hypothetical protein
MRPDAGAERVVGPRARSGRRWAGDHGRRGSALRGGVRTGTRRLIEAETTQIGLTPDGTRLLAGGVPD